MRMILAITLVVFATKTAAQESTSSILEQAIRALPQHLAGLQQDALPNFDDLRQYAVANVTVGGADQSFGESAATLHDAATAEELLASYREVNRAVVRIATADVKGAQVLSLDDFATGPLTYDWERLNQRYPEVQAILRVSAPATAGAYALVRVEVISPAGPLCGNFIELQRQTNGLWKHTRALADGLWK